MWEQTKNVGITATAGIKDAEYIPSHGKNSVKIHSTNEKAVHEIYFWNELSDGGRRTHSKLWGTANCTEYEGVRFWIKIAENNTYSKLSVFLGQMYTGYWPREEVGFFTYDIVIPRGGFEGYVNIPLSYFKNKQGETLSAENLNFIGFKYKDSGFRETDFWVSDLLLYREAVEGNVPHENSTIVDGSELQVDHIVADGTIVDTVGGEYLGTKVSGVDSNNDNKDQNNGKVSYLLWIVIAGSLLGVAAGITVLIFILKRKKKPV